MDSKLLVADFFQLDDVFVLRYTVAIKRSQMGSIISRRTLVEFCALFSSNMDPGSNMPFRFVSQPLQSGLYEPEGIYLGLPYEGDGLVLQAWGLHPDHYGAFTYNGVALKGHNGVDFGVPPYSKLLAVDSGRVSEISIDRGGFDRYIKLEHRWGESIYAFIGNATVDSGQKVKRGMVLGDAGAAIETDLSLALLHFGIRIAPYNRFDGWGGFSDPIPYMNPSDLHLPENDVARELIENPHSMVVESGQMRRP